MSAKRHSVVFQELEERLEVLVSQNSHLADENENFLNIIQKKNSEIELWRSKYQGEQTSSVSA